MTNSFRIVALGALCLASSAFAGKGEDSARQRVAAALRAAIAACSQESDSPVAQLCKDVDEVCDGTYWNFLRPGSGELAQCDPYAPRVDEAALKEATKAKSGETLAFVADGVGTEVLRATAAGGGLATTNFELAVPPVLSSEISRCLDDASCHSLANLDGTAKVALALWCDANNYFPVSAYNGVKSACSAVEKYRKDLEAQASVYAAEEGLQRAQRRFLRAAHQLVKLHASVKASEGRVATEDAAVKAEQASVGSPPGAGATDQDRETFRAAEAQVTGAKQKREAEIATLKRDEAAAASQRETLEKTVKEVDAAIQQTKTAAAAATDPDAPLRTVSRLELARLQNTLTTGRNCSGFGLTVPLYSVRHSPGEPYDLKGPIDAGIGAGYYWAPLCSNVFTAGLQGFLFSEGLDPSKTFQLGVAVGPSLAVFKQFHVGLAFGLDLFRLRQVAATDSAPAQVRTNGLFTSSKPPTTSNVVFMFTFAVTGNSSSATND